MEESGMPPWLKVAWQEYEKYKDVKEHEEPLASRIKEYHRNTIYANSGKDKPAEKWSHKDSWCASFVKWCLNKANFDNTYEIDTLAYGFKPNAWKEGEVHKPKENNGKGKPFVGAIAVFNFSHVAFVIGKTSNNKIVALGGNQGTYYINCTTVGSSAVLYYMKPKSYNVSDELEDLPILTVTGGEMSHANTR